VASDKALAAAAPYEQYLARPVPQVAEDLERFCALLAKWNVSQNLVSRETVSDIWNRHVADSLQLLRFLRPEDHRFADIGSGGGFPAIPLAIARHGSDTEHVLIESSSKKASFLRAAIRELGLSATVVAGRAEQFETGEALGVVTARAVAALPALLGLAAPLFTPLTRGIFHKGREYRAEMEEAAALWRFDVLVHASDTDPSGVLLEISNLTQRQRLSGNNE
jgi:16S rRNA (guanine527-N7)-methyltransferase